MTDQRSKIKLSSLSTSTNLEVHSMTENSRTGLMAQTSPELEEEISAWVAKALVISGRQVTLQ